MKVTRRSQNEEDALLTPNAFNVNIQERREFLRFENGRVPTTGTRGLRRVPKTLPVLAKN